MDPLVHSLSAVDDTVYVGSLNKNIYAMDDDDGTG